MLKSFPIHWFQWTPIIVYTVSTKTNYTVHTSLFPHTGMEVLESKDRRVFMQIYILARQMYVNKSLSLFVHCLHLQISPLNLAVIPKTFLPILYVLCLVHEELRNIKQVTDINNELGIYCDQPRCSAL